MSERRVVDGITEKKCPDCLEFFPETPDHFYRMRSGLRAPCKPCYIDGMMKRRPHTMPMVQTAADWLDRITRSWGRNEFA